MTLTEKEKMLGGELYDASDETLVAERDFAKDLVYCYNAAHPSSKEERKEIMNMLIRPAGSFNIEAPFRCDYGYNIEVGENFYANYGLTILDVCKVMIGNNVLIGPNVQIYTATHPIKADERIKGLEFGKEIVIGDNVWIGGGAIICPGVIIGNNSVIGAGSVVTKDVMEGVVVAGNPAKVIREI